MSSEITSEDFSSRLCPITGNWDNATHCAVLDLDAKIGIERAKSRQSGELDRIENESLAFFEAVRNGYLKLAKKEPERFKTIDGLLSVNAIKKIIWDTVVDQF